MMCYCQLCGTAELTSVCTPDMAVLTRKLPLTKDALESPWYSAATGSFGGSSRLYSAPIAKTMYSSASSCGLTAPVLPSILVYTRSKIGSKYCRGTTSYLHEMGA